ncbi:MAG: hypothetical protein QOK10_3079 [Pseudonocardiales bacterium]|jgi:hypothetical protein|nr:hypothetical protein [Pseudonocardiales bacterium]
MTENLPQPPAGPILLDAVAAEIEAFAAGAGWGGSPTLFALVPTRTLATDPAASSVLSPDGSPLDPDAISESALTPIAQEELPDGALDEILSQIGWPSEVVGCALSQEIVMLPPSAETALDDLDLDAALDAATTHPERREARLVVAVLRDGRSAGVLRLRATDGAADDLLTGAELAPNLVAALSATLSD